MTATICVIASGPTDVPVDGRRLLEESLSSAGLWADLRAAVDATCGSAAQLDVLVLPELLCFDAGAPAGTQPLLVEHLVDLLGEHGYERVAVGMTLGNEDEWLDGRDLRRVTDVAGYRRVTDDGRPYEIVDLSEDVVAVRFPPSSALHGSGLSQRWVGADYRITFAKNRTHEEHGFALCLHNMLGALPLKDRLYHYRGRLMPWDVCTDLLRCAPAQFAVIDAVSSSHGSGGSRRPEPLVTATIIASSSTLLADWVGALKMGVDPHLSALNHHALTTIGLPAAYDVVGDMDPYKGWSNVHPALLAGTRRINDSIGLSRALAPLTTGVDRSLFAFKSAALEHANRVLHAVAAPAADDPVAGRAAIWLNAWLATAAEGVDAWRTLFAKDQLRWRDVSLGLDTDCLCPADYEAVDAYVEPLEQLIRATPGDHGGMRWRYLDESVLFEFSRVLPITYEQFTARVDISRAIQYMQDYIGGRCVPIAWDAAGRVTHQAERNIYLPQPNYLVLYGGDAIDVTKLEHVTYTEHRQRIRWRTVTSANGSAQYDDGSVCFAHVDGGYTEITVTGRQRFTLPPFWQAVDLDSMPEIKNPLVSDAYYTFFDGTMSNFEAAYAGREYRIGQPWCSDEGERDGADRAPTSALDIGTVVHRAGELLRRAQSTATAGALPRVTAGRDPGTLDEDGFRVFEPKPAARGPRSPLGPVERFISDLGGAIQRDFGLSSGDR